MNSEFPALVRKNFDFLFDKFGFSIKSEKYTDYPLSEWVILLTSKNLYFQVSIDKGLINVSLGIPGRNERPIDLMFVLMYATKNLEWNYIWPGGQVNEQYYDKQLQHVARALSENFEKIRSTVQEITKSKKEKKHFDKFVREYFQKNLLGF